MTAEPTAAGWYWHIHHDRLVEYSHNINERIKYIKAYKPKDEQELRLRLLKRVKGQLPEALVKARAAYDKAEAACDKAWAAYVKADAARIKAWAACDKAWAARVKAWAAYVKARADNMPAIIALHEQECPACPWDGKTIFPATQKGKT